MAHPVDAVRSRTPRPRVCSATGQLEKGTTVPALLRLSSPHFRDGEPIPEQFSKDGGNAIPTLEWNAPPEGTVELVILCDDPDTPVGTWVHWVAAGIDPQTRRIEGELPAGSVEGGNDFKESGYGGPQPPPGDGVHRYFFHIYALRAPSGLSAGATADDLRRAVVGNELARGVLIGTFER
jgi:Raf kinase inhibitor-like YbhB/YbcL family protein